MTVGTSASISDLAALGAHFVRLRDKVPSGYGKCVKGCNKPPGASHAEGCRSWKAVNLPASEALMLASEGRLGLVPASVGLYAVDVDAHEGSERRALTEGEVNAARVLWRMLFDGRESGVQRTASGGAHLLFRVKAGKSAQVSWQCRVDRKSPVLVEGDTRHDRGYIAVYDVDAVAGAACDNDASELSLPSNPKSDLGRYARAAGLCVEPSGNRHNYMVSGVMKDVMSSAIDEPEAWLTASELCWSDDDALKQVRDAWQSAVDKAGPPDASGWRQSSAPAGAGALCAVDHGLESRERVASACALVGDLRVFDGDLHVLDGDGVWIASDDARSDVRGRLFEAGVCHQCLNGLTAGVHLRMKMAGREVKSELPASFLIDGRVHVVDTLGRTAERMGFDDVLPLHRIREVEPSDLCIYRPTFDIGAYREVRSSTPSLAEDVLLAQSFGMHECCIGWLLRWMSRACESPEKLSPFVLADTNAGKGTFSSMFDAVLSENAVLSFGGEEADMYLGEDFQMSVFVVGDEVQDTRDQGWSMMKVRTGGGRAVKRGMRRKGPSRRSRASLIVMAERGNMTFHGRFKGGWDRSRFAYFVAPFANKLGYADRMRLQSADALSHFWWRVLTSDSEPSPDNLRECGHMRRSRDAVGAALSSEKMRLAISDEGFLIC